MHTSSTQTDHVPFGVATRINGSIYGVDNNDSVTAGADGGIIAFLVAIPALVIMGLFLASVGSF